MQDLDQWKRVAKEWFVRLQSDICNTLESIEARASSNATFLKTNWKHCDTSNPNADAGGGLMAVMRGKVFEKAGVNTSTTYGKFSDAFAKQIPGAEEDPSYWASGISLVIHPKNPYVPIVHMNTRLICTQKAWFGGGADLTPVFPFEEDTRFFHEAFKSACDKHDPHFYPDFSKWCDKYFYIKHRKEPRGVGGIFYDYQFIENQNDFDKLFAFTKDVGKTFEQTYHDIVLKHFEKPWSDAEEYQQSVKRSRYVEFNLVYDRGTQFGLQNNGNTDAILMSMPPKAVWY
ncbi:MAG: Oxygen-dependent coproporphyrinogen-III oxidase [Holosporales bacterium]